MTIKAILEDFRAASGRQQFVMYGIWTVVVSGLFQLEDAWQLISTTWKFFGAFVVYAAIFESLWLTKYFLLLCNFTAVATGAVFTSKAMQFRDGEILRAATQSHYFVILIVAVWGFYLANLCQRQIWEAETMGNVK